VAIISVPQLTGADSLDLWICFAIVTFVTNQSCAPL